MPGEFTPTHGETSRDPVFFYTTRHAILAWDSTEHIGDVSFSLRYKLSLLFIHLLMQLVILLLFVLLCFRLLYLTVLIRKCFFMDSVRISRIIL